MSPLHRFALRYRWLIFSLVFGFGAGMTLLLWNLGEGYPWGFRLVVAVGLGTLSTDFVGMAYLDWVRAQDK
jgi:hypothetical protein